jgi:hypothetical protein
MANYALLELTVDLEARYDNPYDAREVRLEGVFTGPDGSTWNVPGFWDMARPDHNRLPGRSL